MYISIADLMLVTFFLVDNWYQRKGARLLGRTVGFVRRAAELLGTSMGGLYLMRPDGQTLELVASYNLPRDYTGVTLRLGEGLSGRVARIGEPMMVDDYSRWDERAGLYADLGTRRVLGVPLKVGNRVIGVINVSDDQKTGPFDEDQVRLLSLFADQVAVAVENARLVEALRQQNEYLAALQETMLDLISRLNLDNLLENIVKRAGQLLGTPHCYLDLVEPETGRLKPKIGVGALSQSLQFEVKPGEGVAGTVWQTGQPVVIDDYDAWPDRVQDFSPSTIHAVIGVPMLSGSQVTGVLGLAYDFTTDQAFGQQSVELLSQFARLAAIAIENAHLFEQAQREIADRKRAEEAEREQRVLAEALRAAAAALNSTLEFDLVLDHVLANVGRVVPHDAANIMLIDERGDARIARARGYAEQTLEKVLSLHMPVASTPNFRRMAETAQPVFMSDTHADPAWIKTKEFMWVRSYAGMPIRLKGKVIGILNLESATPGFFTPAHTDHLRAFADQAAIAIENARLYNEARRYAEELEQQARDLQARNEELDAFAHTVAHDLKNPLGLIMGHAELLAQENATLSDGQQRSFQAVVRNGRKMNSIIEELLLLAEVRQVQVSTTPLNMASIVSEAQQRLADMVGQYHAEILVPDASAWPVAVGYAPWVEEVWVNYFSNALKYGGRPPRLELGAETLPDGRARFWVRDNGAGLTPEDQARLFTPFTRLDQVQVKGHGLGLSIVRRIVEKLGGQVGVESQVGQGSVFSFTLPGCPASSRVSSQ